MIIEIDGNDGVGKTFLINILKEKYPHLTFKDRGVLSRATLSEEFDKETPNLDDACKLNKEDVYILIDDTIESCQKRILSRGDSIDVEYHNVADLTKFRRRFLMLQAHFDFPLIERNGQDYSEKDINYICQIINNKQNG